MTTTTVARPLTSPKNKNTAPRASPINQQWLNELGRAEISFGKSAAQPLHGEVALLLPLKQDQQQLLFTQGNWRRSQGDTTLNIGVGQRWFNTTAGYWGYNLFYDYRLQGHHQRLGLGVEQRNNTLSWSLNGYLPLSAKRGDDHSANTLRPARGIDLRLSYQPLQQPHWRCKLRGERYFGHTLAESSKSLSHNRSAVTAGIDYTPWPLITAGYGYQLGSGRQRTHQWQLTLTYRLGMPLAQQLDPKQVAAAHSLAGSRLALVQRNHHILLQQQPNDAIQLELPPELRGKAGTQQTVTFRLHSARPRDEWTLAWQGDLLTHSGTPQINGAADQATLILPNRPGIYTLQLQVHNARNKKGSSNQMRIIVEEWPVAGKTGDPHPRRAHASQDIKPEDDLLTQNEALSQSSQTQNSPPVPPLDPQEVMASVVESEPIQLPKNSHLEDPISDLKTADCTPTNSTVEESSLEKCDALSRSSTLKTICYDNDLSEDDLLLGDSESSDISLRSKEVFNANCDELIPDCKEASCFRAPEFYIASEDDSILEDDSSLMAWDELDLDCKKASYCPIPEHFYIASEDDSILDDSESTDVRPRSEEVFDSDWNKLILDILEECQGASGSGATEPVDMTAEDQSSFTLSPRPTA